MTTKFAWHVLAALMLMAGSRTLAEKALSGSKYSYDESDYMFAATRGVVPNWIDSPAISLPEFVRMGMKRGSDAGSRSELSEFIRDSGDIHFYRHWHGPLYFYGLAVLKPWTVDEREMRAASLWIPAAGVLLVYFGCLWILPGEPVAALLAAALYGVGYTVANTSELAPHQLFILLSMTGLFCLAKLEVSGLQRFWWWAVAAIALSIVAMEVAFVGVAVLLLMGWRRRQELRTGISFWARSVGLFMAVAFVAWPAGLLKLDLVRSYLFMAYLALFRKGAWGDVTLAGTWAERFLSAPLEWLLVIIAVVVWWRGPRLALHHLAARPFLWFGLLMLATTAKVYTVSPRYALLFLAPLAVFAGLALGTELKSTVGHRQRAAILAAAGIGLIVACETWIYMQRNPISPDLQAAHIVDTLRSHPLDGQRLLTPQNYVPLLHYYFPLVRLSSYHDEAERLKAIKGGGIDAVLNGSEVVRTPVP